MITGKLLQKVWKMLEKSQNKKKTNDKNKRETFNRKTIVF